MPQLLALKFCHSYWHWGHVVRCNDYWHFKPIGSTAFANSEDVKSSIFLFRVHIKSQGFKNLLNIFLAILVLLLQQLAVQVGGQSVGYFLLGDEFFYCKILFLVFSLLKKCVSHVVGNLQTNSPTNQENWPNVFPYMALYWANVLAIVPTLGQFSWFFGSNLFVFRKKKVSVRTFSFTSFDLLIKYFYIKY